MKELSIKEKAEAYDEALDRAKKLYEQGTITESLSYVFPELKEESEDEKIKKAIYSALKYLEGELSWDMLYNRVDILDAYAWLEKQGKQSIQNVPSRKVILAIWDLGNEWKELTNGCISTEYGTQLDYIQKHWKESEYYLRAKQGERKPQRMISAEAKEAMYGNPAWSGEDENEVAILEAYIRSGEWSESHIDRALGIVDELVNKVKSLRPQNRWKPSEEQIMCLQDALSDYHRRGYKAETLETLLKQLKQL